MENSLRCFGYYLHQLLHYFKLITKNNRSMSYYRLVYKARNILHLVTPFIDSNLIMTPEYIFMYFPKACTNYVLTWTWKTIITNTFWNRVSMHPHLFQAKLFFMFVFSDFTKYASYCALHVDKGRAWFSVKLDGKVSRKNLTFSL